jgi:hypothetical protein
MGIFGQKVDDLAFSFISPLHANHSKRGFLLSHIALLNWANHIGSRKSRELLFFALFFPLIKFLETLYL